MNKIRVEGISGDLYTPKELVAEVRKFHDFNEGLLRYYKKKMKKNIHYINFNPRLTLYTRQALEALRIQYEKVL